MGAVSFKGGEGHDVFDISDGMSSASGGITPQTPSGQAAPVQLESLPEASTEDREASVDEVIREAKGRGENPVDLVLREQKEYVPTVFRWEHGGEKVYVTGTFNNWSQKIEMRRSGNDFTYIHNLKRGKHAYKFIVDEEWRFAPDQSTVYDPNGHINNFIDLTSFRTHEEEEAAAQAEKAEHREDDEYGQEVPDLDEYSKQPPMLPPHLRQIVLNSPPSPEDPRRLQTPLHVTLNHLHCTAIKDRLMVLGVTQRYRRKFVTTVFYSWLPS